MIEREVIKRELRASLRYLNPVHIFVFESYAHGTAQTHSDVDVLVVVDTDGLPADYEQCRALMLKVRGRLLPLSRRFPMDFLVLAKPEWQELRKKHPEFADAVETEALPFINEQAKAWFYRATKGHIGHIESLSWEPSAVRAIQGHQQSKLTPEESTIFVKAVLDPAAPNTALQAAFRRYCRDGCAVG
jgi:predicted nucleotidyltransferase